MTIRSPRRLAALGRLLALGGGMLAAAAAPASAEDGWPMWRADAGRTAYASRPLPDALHLRWVRRLPPQVPGWKDEGEMKFDRSYQPIAVDKRLIVGSTVNDTVTAYDLETGEEAWRFYAEGPIRVAPAAWKGKVYAASDDGYLYCLNASDGRLKWKSHGGPSTRRLIGNERLISTWPMRGGPAVADGVVYAAGGVWPFMGAFVYAFDAETGRALWTGDGASFTYRYRPHPNATAHSGLSPQGHLVVSGNRLIVPGSRSAPAVFDRRTGEFLYYGEGSSPTACAQGPYAFSGGQVFHLDKGSSVRLDGLRLVGRPVLAPNAWHTAAGTLDPAGLVLKDSSVQELRHSFDRESPVNRVPVLTGSIARRGAIAGTPWLQAGNRLVVTDKQSIQLLDVSDPASPKILWQGPIAETVSDALAPGGKLIVVTLEGTISCFSDKAGSAKTHERASPAPAAPTAWAEPAATLLRQTGATEGYALVCGIKDGGLAEELIRQSRLHVIVLDRDAAKVDALRRRLDAAGLYGTRAAALVGDLLSVPFAPYWAGLAASEDPEAAGLARGAAFVEKLFAVLRPYGGAACLPLPAGRSGPFAEAVKEAKLAGAELKPAGAWTFLLRQGPLPGSAPWCGQNADPGGTRCGRDQLVKAPLGVLWFGNSLSNQLVLPRHGEGPVPQVAGGRLVIEGPNSLSAMDVYTGRFLWTREFTGLGKYFDIGKHQRGAHALGGNFFFVPDAVYVALGDACAVLDPATGKTINEFKLPENSSWFFLLVYNDLLIAGLHPVIKENRAKRYNDPGISQGLAALDRRSGKVLWTRRAASDGIRHYAIAAGGGKVFCVDDGKIVALDARAGTVVWQTEKGAGKHLSYSEEHDVVVSAGALKGKDGTLIWDELTRPAIPPPDAASSVAPDPGDASPGKAEPGAPAPKPVAPPPAPEPQTTEALIWSGKWGPILNGNQIITQPGRVFDLLTGRQKTWIDVTGQPREWRFRRSHGCGPVGGSRYLITLRSADAAYVDLANDGGTANLGGFRSGCTMNLIAADGVLSVPDYTRTCGCGYSNRSSLGLIHMEDLEYWSFGANPSPGRVAFNFGAPADRRAPDGTLWWGIAPLPPPHYQGRKQIPTVPPEPRRFYRHVSRMTPGEGWAWVGASGLAGIRSLQAPLEGLEVSKDLVVRLYFSEPEWTEPGRRVFSVSLDGKEVVKNLDILKEAGAPAKTLVKEIRGVRFGGRTNKDKPLLEVTFAAASGEPLICGIEVVEAGR